VSDNEQDRNREARLRRAMEAVREARARNAQARCEGDGNEKGEEVDPPTCCPYHTLRWLRSLFKSGKQTVVWSCESRKVVVKALEYGILAAMAMMLERDQPEAEPEREAPEEPEPVPEDARVMDKLLREIGLSELADAMGLGGKDTPKAKPGEQKPDQVEVQIVGDGLVITAGGNSVKLSPSGAAITGGVIAGMVTGSVYEDLYKVAFDKAYADAQRLREEYRAENEEDQ